MHDPAIGTSWDSANCNRNFWSDLVRQILLNPDLHSAVKKITRRHFHISQIITVILDILSNNFFFAVNKKAIVMASIWEFIASQTTILKNPEY